MRSPTTVAMTAALVVVWAACAEFASDDTPGDPAGLDGGVPDAIADPDFVEVDAPTELALGADPAFLYIATSQAVATPFYRWDLSTTKPTAFGDPVASAHGVVARSGSLLFIGDQRAVYELATSGVDAGARRACLSDALSFALYNGNVVYSTTSETLFTPYPECVPPVRIVGAQTKLMATTTTAVFRYEPAVLGGRIVTTSAPSANSGGAPVIEGIGTAVTAMIADADYVYWATPTTIQKAARGTDGGAPAIPLADNQRLPRTLALQGGDIFWTNYESGTMMRQPTNGSSPAVTVIQDVKNPWGLVVTARELFVALHGENRVRRVTR